MISRILWLSFCFLMVYLEALAAPDNFSNDDSKVKMDLIDGDFLSSPSQSSSKDKIKIWESVSLQPWEVRKKGIENKKNEKAKQEAIQKAIQKCGKVGCGESDGGYDLKNYGELYYMKGGKCELVTEDCKGDKINEYECNPKSSNSYTWHVKDCKAAYGDNYTCNFGACTTAAKLTAPFCNDTCDQANYAALLQSLPYQPPIAGILNQSDSDQDLSFGYELSRCGLCMLFGSEATDLVTEDENNKSDLYLYNNLTKKLVLVTKSVNGVSLNESVQSPNPAFNFMSLSMSQNGRYVGFSSSSDEVISPDPNGHKSDCFVYDQFNDEMVGINVDASGATYEKGKYCNADMNADGRFLAFSFYGANPSTTPLTPVEVEHPSLIYLRDRLTDITTLFVSNSFNKKPFPLMDAKYAGINSTGSYVAFATATELTSENNYGIPNWYVKDSVIGKVDKVNYDKDGKSMIISPSSLNEVHPKPVMSKNGKFALFSIIKSFEDTPNNKGGYFLYLWDRDNNTTHFVDSYDGSFPNSGYHMKMRPRMDEAGQYIVFTSAASNIVPNDTNEKMDVFIYKRTTQEFKRIMGYDGDEIDEAVLSADITPDGKVILLSSKASNIVPNGEKGAMRAYLVKNPFFQD